jgi:hypothetical protein
MIDYCGKKFYDSEPKKCVLLSVCGCEREKPEKERERERVRGFCDLERKHVPL